MSKVTDWKKYEPYFTPEEFRCKCGCGSCDVDSAFLDMLLKARKIANIPFRISSGCRCEKHNAFCGGTPDSDHLVNEKQICCGADIKTTSDRERFIISKALLTAGFKRIGIAKSFIHAGENSKNPQEVIWLYK